ncbi:MAG: allophanate hydrolase [Segniliparus sp.]|uniref:allophanate hydrolase n=1 Tax=Segniliparus sp. TaxID=2804064 RepID=UPI003F2F1C9B
MSIGVHTSRRAAAAYERIAEVDRPEIWTALRPQEEVERDVAAASGPLAGLLLAVKDNVDVAGLPTTAGCPAYAYRPEADAPVVAALRAAGATVLGKTNLDQFATGLVGVRSPYGAVRDARRPDRVSGGSSSGSAVAVALGLADIAIGTDTAGSGRVPAGLQGIVGVKPTVGVVSTAGVVPACRSYDCVTVFARTVVSANTAMAAMARAGGRPWPESRRLAAPARPRIAVPRELVGLDAQWREAFHAAVARIPDVEVEAVDLGPFLEAARLLYDGGLVAERYDAVGEFVEAHWDECDPTVRGIVSRAKSVSAAELLADRERVARLRERSMGSLEGFDALVVPTAPCHPTIAQVLADPLGVNSAMGVYTNFCNLFDMCAASVPAGVAGPADDVAQFGVTVLGRAFDDAAVLDIAARLTGERVDAPWTPAGAQLVVFGAHLRGMPLEHQLIGLGARWAGEVRTAACYRLKSLDTTPPKPGLVRVADGGASVLGERWLLTPAALGRFLSDLPSPMLLGSVLLEDGSWATGFGCEAVAAADAEDITRFGGWRDAVAAGAL